MWPRYSGTICNRNTGNNQMPINRTIDKLSSHLMQYQMNESENTSTWINHKNKMLSEKKKKRFALWNVGRVWYHTCKLLKYSKWCSVLRVLMYAKMCVQNMSSCTERIHIQLSVISGGKKGTKLRGDTQAIQRNKQKN